MKNQAAYSVRDLAEVIGVSPETLQGRIRLCEEKPEAIALKLFKGNNKQEGRLFRKDEFLAWHKRNWIDTGKSKV